MPLWCDCQRLGFLNTADWADLVGKTRQAVGLGSGGTEKHKGHTECLGPTMREASPTVLKLGNMGEA